MVIFVLLGSAVVCTWEIIADEASNGQYIREVSSEKASIPLRSSNGPGVRCGVIPVDELPDRPPPPLRIHTRTSQLKVEDTSIICKGFLIYAHLIVPGPGTGTS